MFSLISFVQINPTNEYPGLLLWGKETNPIRIEIYIDLLCIDCANDYPIVKQVWDHYKENNSISIRYHFWELPQHKWGFIVSRATYALHILNDSQVIPFLDTFLGDPNVQAEFYNSATKDKTQTIVTQLLLQKMANITGVNLEELTNEYNQGNGDSYARTDFKFSNIKNLPGTPTVFINGAMSSLNEMSTLEDWIAQIDELLNA